MANEYWKQDQERNPGLNGYVKQTFEFGFSLGEDQDKILKERGFNKISEKVYEKTELVTVRNLIIVEP